MAQQVKFSRCEQMGERWVSTVTADGVVVGTFTYWEGDSTMWEPDESMVKFCRGCRCIQGHGNINNVKRAVRDVIGAREEKLEEKIEATAEVVRGDGMTSADGKAVSWYSMRGWRYGIVQARGRIWARVKFPTADGLGQVRKVRIEDLCEIPKTWSEVA